MSNYLGLAKLSKRLPQDIAEVSGQVDFMVTQHNTRPVR